MDLNQYTSSGPEHLRFNTTETGTELDALPTAYLLAAEAMDGPVFVRHLSSTEASKTVDVGGPSTIVTRLALEAWSNRSGQHFRGLSLEDGAEVLDRTIANLLTDLTSADEPLTTLIAQFLAAHLVCKYGHVEERPKTGGLAPWQQRVAEKMLASDLVTPEPLTTVAARVRLSVSHFSRAFHATTGTSPHQWIMRRRVARAALLLEESTETLAQIASTCGFCDQSHFTRIFSRDYGLPPGLWRRKRQTKETGHIDG